MPPADLTAGRVVRLRTLLAAAGEAARFFAPSAALLAAFDAAARAGDAFALAPDRAGLVALDAPLGDARSLRAVVRRALALLDFDSSSAACLSPAGVFPGGLLVTTAVGRS